ncbi:MAG: endonuclease/exonuclease/phosphatase family protein [Thermoguttaceae bacterium]|jgi:endonuclease/exonuclease/phosphatase (EEP) superfamily protein YafD|nr:endonuclease/exonuclease/phosphatase family protein [Thermoguttaceae bacterium]
MFRSPTFYGALAVYGYTGIVLLACGLMWVAGDRWWVATLILFGPRWVVGIPLVALVPLALAVRPRWLWPLGLSAVVVLWPIMGLRLPWRTLADPLHADLRVMTYNIDQCRVDEQSFAELLEVLQPDLVAVQECPWWARWRVPDHWHVERAGELLVISAHPIVDVEVSRSQPSQWRGSYVNGLYCVVETPVGRIGFANVHLETPRHGLSAVLDRDRLVDLEQADYADARIQARRLDSEAMARWLASFPEPKIIAGDFNMPVESTIYREFWQGYENAFNRAGLGFGYSKQTAIRNRVYGTRIDHILTDAHWRAIRSHLGPDLGSDHLPLVADVRRELEDGTW